MCRGSRGVRGSTWGLPRLPNWIVPLRRRLIYIIWWVSFTVSHGASDEWHPQKIIFLLGCNKSYVKCSSAYIANGNEKEKKKDTRTLFFSNFPSFLILFHPHWEFKLLTMERLPAILINNIDREEKFHQICLCRSLYIHYRSKVWGHPDNFVSSMKTHFYLSNELKI